MSASQTAAVLTDTSSWRATPLMVSSVSQILRSVVLVGWGESDVTAVEPRGAGGVDAVSFEGEVDGASGDAEFVGDDRGRHFAEASAKPLAVVECRWGAELLHGAVVSAFDAVVSHGGQHHLRVDAEFLGDLRGGGLLVAGTEPVGVVELGGSSPSA